MLMSLCHVNWCTDVKHDSLLQLGSFTLFPGGLLKNVTCLSPGNIVKVNQLDDDLKHAELYPEKYALVCGRDFWGWDLYNYFFFVQEFRLKEELPPVAAAYYVLRLLVLTCRVFRCLRLFIFYELIILCFFSINNFMDIYGSEYVLEPLTPP